VKRQDTVVASFFGDGATEEGAFHESLNFAALKSVPIIFICENNGLSIHSRQLERQRVSNIFERARTYGMPAERIEGNDVLSIRESVERVAQAIRAGQPGPYFFECMTYRWREHVGPNEDFAAGYRTREEAEPWMRDDQVKRIGGMIDASLRSRIEQEVEAEVADAFEFAERSPLPDDRELYTDMFKEL